MRQHLPNRSRRDLVAALAAAPLAALPGAAATAPDPRRLRIAANPPALNAGVPNGGPQAAVRGFFGPVIPWPSVPIHWVLTPDGRVLNFGATSTGLQGGDLDYSVWDPAQGTGADAFLLLPNTTAVNTFCAGQWLFPSTGRVLLTGGTRIMGTIRGIGIADVTIYDPRTSGLAATTPMALRRWYATTIGLLDGTVLALGGRIDPPVLDNPLTAASTPEIYDPRSRAWRALPAVASDTAYGRANNAWFYPRAWIAPDGSVFILTHAGLAYRLQTGGAGTLTAYAARTAPENSHMTSAMYAPGRIISVRDGPVTALVDLNGPEPVITSGTPPTRHRRYGNGTLLPNGRLFLNGGTSADDNVLDGMHLISETWDPATGQWTETAAAAIPRLYHSNAILLPDGTVLTGGGGLPGPLTNDNAEIYYPPYLYRNDGSGAPAQRPRIETGALSLGWDTPFTVRVLRSTKPIARVTLLRSSHATHAFNNGQRFQELPFTRSGDLLSLRTPATASLAPPGYYLLFALDSAGVPSVARPLRLIA